MSRGGNLHRLGKREVPVLTVDAFGMRCKAAMQRVGEIGLDAWRAEELVKLEEEPDAEWEAFVRGVGAAPPPGRTDGGADREAADRGARRRAGDFDFDQA